MGKIWSKITGRGGDQNNNKRGKDGKNLAASHRDNNKVNNRNSRQIVKEVHKGPKGLKIVLVGDTAVGKSCLIINYLNEQFDEHYEPSVLDVFSGSMTFN